MPTAKAITELETILRSRDDASVKAVKIIMLAPKLPYAAIDTLDDGLDGADPIVQVAIMDAYFRMTGDNFHKQDLERILAKAARGGDGNEELYMAARIALGHINGCKKDQLNELGDAGFEIRALAGVRRGVTRRATKRAVAVAPAPVNTLTIMIHGTWAADGIWWRPGGDFFEYVKKDLMRADLYGGRDQFMWSGKNRDSARKKAAMSLKQWIAAHPAAEVNIFAHSHGANVAMLATHDDIRINQLVMLSPPVRKDYYAKWANVAKPYNIQASFDPVVAIAQGGQCFNLARVKEKKLKASGHSASHDPAVWRSEHLDRFIGIPW